MLAILVMASLAALFAWALGSFEPRYQGLPASRYLRAVLSTNATPSATQTAVTLVPARVAVPILIEFTQTQDPRWRGWYQRLYPRLPLALQPVDGATPPEVFTRWMYVACERRDPPIGPCCAPTTCRSNHGIAPGAT